VLTLGLKVAPLRHLSSSQGMQNSFKDTFMRKMASVSRQKVERQLVLIFTALLCSPCCRRREEFSCRKIRRRLRACEICKTRRAPLSHVYSHCHCPEAGTFLHVNCRIFFKWWCRAGDVFRNARDDGRGRKVLTLLHHSSDMF
jgi:hypothetical protein